MVQKERLAFVVCCSNEQLVTASSTISSAVARSFWSWPAYDISSSGDVLLHTAPAYVSAAEVLPRGE